MEGEQPYLGDLLTMVINHLLTGMILQPTRVFSGPRVTDRSFYPQVLPGRELHRAIRFSRTAKLGSGGFLQAVSVGDSVVGFDLGGGNSNIVYFHPYLGKIPTLTSIFFRWVETTNQ